MNRPDDPPPQPAPRHVAPYVILLVFLGIVTPFVVSWYRTGQLSANEIAVVQALRDIAKAQDARFAAKGEYAQNFSELGGALSQLPEMDEGIRQDNVVTPAKVEDPSIQSGQRKVDAHAKSPAYHGYRFRMLKGASDASGSKSFVDEKGRMTAGFAVLAVPEKYGFTGRDTFLMNGQVIYVKDFDAYTDRVTQPLYHFTLPEGAEKIQ